MTPIAGIEFECSPMFRAAGRVTEIKHLDGEDEVTVTFLVPPVFKWCGHISGKAQPVDPTVAGGSRCEVDNRAPHKTTRIRARRYCGSQWLRNGKYGSPVVEGFVNRSDEAPSACSSTYPGAFLRRIWNSKPRSRSARPPF